MTTDDDEDLTEADVDAIPEGDTFELLRAATRTLIRVRRNQALDNAKRDRRIRFSQIAITLALTLVLAVGWVAWRAIENGNDARNAARVATAAAHKANATARALIVERDERALSSCLQANDQRRSILHAQIRASHAFAAAIIGPFPSPEIAARARRFNKNQDARYRRGFAKRDCSTVGVRKYLTTTKAEQRSADRHPGTTPTTLHRP